MKVRMKFDAEHRPHVDGVWFDGPVGTCVSVIVDDNNRVESVEIVEPSDYPNAFVVERHHRR